MKSRTAIPLLITFWSIQFALAGAWDVGAFDNDDALDWTWELELSEDLSVVTAALKGVVDSSGYVESPTAAAAIAAAEVVAALKGNPAPMLPENVSGWVRANSLEDNSELPELAKRAIARVQDLEQSELAQLWADSDEYFEQWSSELSKLNLRLE